MNKWALNIWINVWVCVRWMGRQGGCRENCAIFNWTITFASESARIVTGLEPCMHERTTHSVFKVFPTLVRKIEQNKFPISIFANLTADVYANRRSMLLFRFHQCCSQHSGTTVGEMWNEQSANSIHHIYGRIIFVDANEHLRNLDSTFEMCE